MTNEIRFMYPMNLKLDEIMSGLMEEVERKKIKKEKLLFLIDYLLRRRALRRSEMIEEDIIYVNLSSKKLQAVITAYKVHLKFLIEAGVFTSDKRYIIGDKCIGYSLSGTYAGVELVSVPVSSWTLKKAIRKQQENAKLKWKELHKGYSYLLRSWESKKLNIDIDAANEWIAQDLSTKINSLPGKLNTVTKAEKITVFKDTSVDYKNLVNSISKGQYYYSFSGKGHRFYSSLTSLKRELRMFLTYEDEPLVEIDLVNSQPFLCSCLLNKNFWIKKNKKDFSIYSIDKVLYKDIGISCIHSIIMILECPEMQSCRGFSSDIFCRLVADGAFYSYIQEHFKGEYPKKFIDRDRTKKEVMMMLFSDPEKVIKYIKNPSILFAKYFPVLQEVIRLIKKNDYTLLPILLQRIESYLIIDAVGKKLFFEDPNIPFFTIHDSIITTTNNVERVREILVKSIKSLIGMEPQTKIKYLKVAVLNAKLKDAA